MRWRAEIWNLPHESPHKVLIAEPPVQNVQFRPILNRVGQGSIEIPALYSRILEIADDNTDTETLVRVYVEDTLAYSFFAETPSERFEEKNAGAMVTISGPGVESVVDWGILYPWDYPTQPTFAPNWEYGGAAALGTFANGTFDEDDISTGWEDQAVAGWTEIHASTPGFVNNQEDIEISTAEARTGTRSLTFTAGNARSGIERKTIPVIPGGRYTITLYLKEPLNSGDRFTFGAKVDDGFTAHHTNPFTVNGYSMCELGNAVEGAGATDGTWQVFTLDITFFVGDGDTDGQTETELQLVYEDATLGPEVFLDDFTFAGVGAGITPWQEIILSGTHVLFERSSAQAHSGTYSLSWQVNTPTAATGGVLQEVSGATDGQVVTFHAWFYSATATTIRLIIGRQNNGGWMNDVSLAVPAATWTKGSVTATISASDGLINVSARYDGTGLSPVIYMDDALLFVGLPGNNVGKIMQDVLDDAAVDHIAEVSPGAPRSTLVFLKYDGWGDTLDQDGATWIDAELAVRLTRGMRYGQVVNNVVVRYGYEWDVVWNSGASQWEYRQYNPGALGVDRSADDSPAIQSGLDVLDGRINRGIPTRNHVLAEGIDGIWSETGDAGQKTAFSRRETYISDRGALDTVTVGAMAGAELTAQALGGAAIKLTFGDGSTVVPFRDFQMGDTISVDLPESGISGDFRVMAMDVRLSEVGGSTITVDFNNEAVEQAAATEVAVQRILEKFQGLDEGAVATAASPNVTSTQPIEPTFLVASSSARAAIRAVADFVCDGVLDFVEIQTALNAETGPYTVVLTGGTFRHAATVTLTIPAGVVLRGQGENVTNLSMGGSVQTWALVLNGGIERISGPITEGF